MSKQQTIMVRKALLQDLLDTFFFLVKIDSVSFSDAKERHLGLIFMNFQSYDVALILAYDLSERRNFCGWEPHLFFRRVFKVVTCGQKGICIVNWHTAFLRIHAWVINSNILGSKIFTLVINRIQSGKHPLSGAENQGILAWWPHKWQKSDQSTHS